jgi:putative sigma-54 modulation protein
MKFDIKFKSIDFSQGIVDYVEEKFEKLLKFEMKPLTIHVTLSHQRHERLADVYIHGLNNKFRAQGKSDSLFVSLDLCLKKLLRQMEKEKAKIKNHHHYEHSNESQLIHLAHGDMNHNMSDDAYEVSQEDKPRRRSA